MKISQNLNAYFQTANSVDADQKAEKRRKKKKNRKAAAAVVEDQANAGTPTDNKAHHRNRSRGRRQTVCLVCNQPAIEGAADVIECDYRRICGKPYHLKCVQLDAPPHGELGGQMMQVYQTESYTSVASVNQSYMILLTKWMTTGLAVLRVLTVPTVFLPLPILL